MRYRTISVLFPVFFLVCFSHVVLGQDIPPLQPADRYVEDGLVVRLQDVRLTELSSTEKQLAVVYLVQNHSLTKKIDLAPPWNFVLSDEFGNKYRQLGVNSENADFVRNPHYPSLYPQETFQSVVYFEPPLSASQTLMLIVDGSSSGLSEAMKLSFPVERIKIPQTPILRRLPTDRDLTVKISQQYLAATPGTVIPLEIKLAADLERPHKIYFIAPEFVYDDDRLAENYYFRIPREQKPGLLTVVVMVQWAPGEGKEAGFSISQSFSVQVTDPSAVCKGSCLQQQKSP